MYYAHKFKPEREVVEGLDCESIGRLCCLHNLFRIPERR
jgi:hypothetical protein